MAIAGSDRNMHMNTHFIPQALLLLKKITKLFWNVKAPYHDQDFELCQALVKAGASV